MAKRKIQPDPASSEQSFEPIRKRSAERKGKRGQRGGREQRRREQRAARAAQRAELARLAQGTGFDLPEGA